MRIRAVKEEGAAVVDLAERASDVKWTGNGAATSAAARGSTNGSVRGYDLNGSLVKYGSGNGNGAAAVAGGDFSAEASSKRKRRL